MLLQLLQRNADYYPAATAITCGSTVLTHAALLDRVQKLAVGLVQAGIRRGDRVALFLDNSPDAIVSFFAVAACGAINVPLSPECKAEELKFYFRDAGVCCVIVDGQRVALAMQTASAVEQPLQLIVIGASVPGTIAFSEILDNSAGRSPSNACLDEEVVFLYSSGSTGRPKCVPRTAVQYWWETEYMVSTLRLTREDVIFCAIPLYHNYGLVECMLAAAGSGAKLVILEKPHPFILRRKEALRLLEQERVTVFPGLPFLFRQLLDSSAPADLSSLRMCYTAAAALPPDLFEGFFDNYGVFIRQHYGCAEVGALTINTEADPRHSSTSVGRVFPGVRVKVIDDDAREVPTGEAGEVIVGSRAMSRGYLGVEQVNKTAFQDGYFHTGDLGRLDAEGRLYLLGRKKFVIEVAGHKVDPVEVEDVLDAHPNVLGSVVIGVPDAAGHEQIPKAYIVANQPCTEQEIITFCRERLANFKVPQSVAFLTRIPLDPLGKVMRKTEILEGLEKLSMSMDNNL